MEYIGLPYTAPGDEPDSPDEDSTETYIVQSGDTLYSIARKYNTTVSKLKEYNNLTSDILSVGQILKIKEDDNNSSDEYILYTVKSGDNLYKIANANGVTVDRLIEYNNLASDILSIGQVIKIPIKEVILPEGEYIIYTVKSGDNLYQIATQYNTTVDALMKYNNLTTNLLSVGQMLKIPVEIVTPENTYIVKSGDSLWSIANRYNISVDDIRRANNLTSDLLSIGQILIIPTNTTDEDIIYTVQKGDSLWSIARKYNTTVDNIKNKNNLTSDLLSIGQQIRI